MLLYLHFLPYALAAEILGFVEVVCSEAACEGNISQSVSTWDCALCVSTCHLMLLTQATHSGDILYVGKKKFLSNGNVGLTRVIKLDHNNSVAFLKGDAALTYY